MADYIERQAALDALRNVTNDQNCPAFIAATVEQILTEAPAANVREDVQGKWVLENTREKSYMRVCSVCKRTAYCCTPVFSYCFCPNCGARMTGGGER